MQGVWCDRVGGSFRHQHVALCWSKGGTIHALNPYNKGSREKHQQQETFSGHLASAGRDSADLEAIANRRPTTAHKVRSDEERNAMLDNHSDQMTALGL
jgi:hypothetical protein